MNAPHVGACDCISVGLRKSAGQVQAIVVEEPTPGRAEIVHFDSAGNPIGEFVVWTNGGWHFESAEPCGTYAAKSDRLRPFADQLVLHASELPSSEGEA